MNNITNNFEEKRRFCHIREKPSLCETNNEKKEVNVEPKTEYYNFVFFERNNKINEEKTIKTTSVNKWLYFVGGIIIGTLLNKKQ